MTGISILMQDKTISIEERCYCSFCWYW